MWRRFTLSIWAFNSYQNQWFWMILNGVITLILRYFTEFASFRGHTDKSGWRCRKNKLSSLSHLLMSLLYVQLTAECRGRCWGMLFPLKSAPSHGWIWTSCNMCLLWSTRLSIPSGISVGSAVLQGSRQSVPIPYTGPPLSQKIALSHEGIWTSI